MMMSGSTPFSFAIASICWSNGLLVAIYSAISFQLSAVTPQPQRSLICVPHADSRPLAAERRSKLHFQTCAFDASHRHAVRPAPFFEQQVAAVYTRQPSGESRLAVNRFGRHHLGQAPLKSPVVRFVPQRSLEARGR